MSAAKKEFVLTHVFKNVSNSEEKKYYCSPEEKHFGASWKIEYIRDNESFGLYLLCSNNSTEEWSIETQFSLKLISVNGNKLVRAANVEFGNQKKKNNDDWGWPGFSSWEDLEEDYLTDDTVTIKAHVKILKMTGIGKMKLRSFDESMREFSDVVLIVNDEKFFVSKLFLAGQSSYFNALFTRGFKESEQSEITLTDVDPKDFQNFLEVLHGEMAIDDSTITGILQLGDMYHTQTVLQHCEAFLMEKSEKKLKEKLEISAKFNLNKSLNKCLSEIKTVEDVKSLATGDLSEMDRSVQTALFHKLLSLS